MVLWEQRDPSFHSNSVSHCLHMTSLQTDSWAVPQLEELSWCSLSCTNSFWALSLWHGIQWFSSESQFLLESAYLVTASLKEGSKTGLFFAGKKKKKKNILLDLSPIRAIPQWDSWLLTTTLQMSQNGRCEGEREWIQLSWGLPAQKTSVEL